MKEKIQAEDQYRTDVRFMRRALSLARLGAGHVSPNPMVGAVIVSGGRIIGEGWHRRFGQGHAEVNAVASVADESLLRGATIYVTLEPCSHYGKTPPCAKLLIEKGLGRVVVGVLDPFPQVSGRGVRMLREAGIEVVVGVLEEECRELNVRFMTAHTLGRPYIILKWAETADGYIGKIGADGNPAPIAVSGPVGRLLAHRERSRADAIMVGTSTVVADNPRLDCRLWPGRSPRPVGFNRAGRLPAESYVALNTESVIFDGSLSLPDCVATLYRDFGITSLLVEGGARLLASFVEAGLYDCIRVERSAHPLGGSDGVAAPQLPHLVPTEVDVLPDSIVSYYRRR